MVILYPDVFRCSDSFLGALSSDISAVSVVSSKEEEKERDRREQEKERAGEGESRRRREQEKELVEKELVEKVPEEKGKVQLWGTCLTAAPQLLLPLLACQVVRE